MRYTLGVVLAVILSASTSAQVTVTGETRTEYVSPITIEVPLDDWVESARMTTTELSTYTCEDVSIRALALHRELKDSRRHGYWYVVSVRVMTYTEPSRDKWATLSFRFSNGAGQGLTSDGTQGSTPRYRLGERASDITMARINAKEEKETGGELEFVVDANDLTTFLSDPSPRLTITLTVEPR